MAASTRIRRASSMAVPSRCGRIAGSANTSISWRERRIGWQWSTCTPGSAPGAMASSSPTRDVAPPGTQRGTAWWGDVRSMVDGESVSANLNGDWLGALDGLMPGAEVTAVALEFGTVDTVSVLQALRADAVLHASGDPLGDRSGDVRAQVRAAFADDDPTWFDVVAARFDEVVSAALVNLSAY